jgi:hypothetical protein
VEVDLGQDAVKEQVLELLLVADVVVEGAGDHAQAGGQAAHGQGLDAVLGDDRQCFGDDPLAGELGAAVGIVDGGLNHSDRDPPSVAGALDAAVARLLGAACCRCSIWVL